MQLEQSTQVRRTSCCHSNLRLHAVESEKNSFLTSTLGGNGSLQSNSASGRDPRRFE
jgi:hypothetical protein